MLRQLLKRDLIGTVGQCLARILMPLHEYSIASPRHRGSCQNRSQLPVTAGLIACSARPLHRMRGVEDYAVARVSHPVKGPHISHKIIVTKSRSTFSETKLRVSERP